MKYEVYRDEGLPKHRGRSAMSEGTGKCAGKRKPPCGRVSNCAGFAKGFRCGGHAPVGNCPGHGTVKKRQKTIGGIPLDQFDELSQLFGELD